MKTKQNKNPHYLKRTDLNFGSEILVLTRAGSPFFCKSSSLLINILKNGYTLRVWLTLSYWISLNMYISVFINIFKIIEWKDGVWFCNVRPLLRLLKYSLIPGKPGSAGHSCLLGFGMGGQKGSTSECISFRCWGPLHKTQYLPFIPSLEPQDYSYSLYCLEVIKYYILWWYKCYSWRATGKWRQWRVGKKQ